MCVCVCVCVYAVMFDLTPLSPSPSLPLPPLSPPRSQPSCFPGRGAKLGIKFDGFEDGATADADAMQWVDASSVRVRSVPLEQDDNVEVGTPLLALYEKEDVRLYIDARLSAILDGEEAAAAHEERIYQVKFEGGKKGIVGSVAMLAREHILVVKVCVCVCVI